MARGRKEFTEQECLAMLEAVRWPDGPRCPYCDSDNITSMASRSRHHCNACNTSFSPTVKTIFHGTRVPLVTWCRAIKLLLSSRPACSVRRLASETGVHRNTAWRMSRKIREGMADPTLRALFHTIAGTTDREDRQ